MQAEHKIQSSGELKLHLEHTPKMVGLLREHWAPHAYIVTFKVCIGIFHHCMQPL